MVIGKILTCSLLPITCLIYYKAVKNPLFQLSRLALKIVVMARQKARGKRQEARVKSEE
ncbi:MAG: hypothetical protein HEQ20_14810 [Aphanizomenon flos-aquae KM1D3_PB]|uniref:hypothetical protein n=1 Tax=Aphanizomenon flos-aquae TaxID=1176 RepID=UPI000AED91E8|nr:hypothetical protein [Aphanizomenon flos-aquae]QSV71780.1 MAG: hypothetical protein HEQ20_14810 [Aphanizomenon flos-aquae KM1D3_PB]